MSPARGSAFHCLRSSFIYQCRTLALGDSPASRCCGRNGNVDLWQRFCVARGRRALVRRLRMASFFGVSICRKGKPAEKQLKTACESYGKTMELDEPQTEVTWKSPLKPDGRRHRVTAKSLP